MNAPTSNPWQALFLHNGSQSVEARPVRLVRRAGEAFLLLPENGAAAARGLDLYPAQTQKARLLRGLLRGLVRFGLAPGTRRALLEIAPNSRFVQFLADGRRWEDLQLAMLLGNPRAPGRRCILLVMDSQGSPLHAIKAGADEHATTLIRKEAAMLKSLPVARLHSPQLRGEFNAGNLAAISLSYALGQPPDHATDAQLVDLLEGWLNRGLTLPFSSLPHGQRLLASRHLDQTERAALARLSIRPMMTAIHHGDFAPWNIREEPGSGRWTVLDWERGEPQGPPAWDWFHFRVQTAVLVERLQPNTILERIESYLRQPDFQRYASAADIGGLERELLLGYLLHARDIVQQTEGANTVHAMAAQLAARLKAG